MKKMIKIMATGLLMGMVEKDACGMSSLHEAAWNGDTTVVERFLNTGADPDIVDKEKRTPLWVAAYKGHANITKILLNAGANPNKTDTYGLSPLYMAVFNGHADIVEILLNTGANTNMADIFFRNTPLYWAAKDGRTDIVEKLLRAGAVIPEDLDDLLDDEIVEKIQSKILKEEASVFVRGLHVRLGSESPVQLLNGFTEITQFMCNPDEKELP